MLYIKDVCKAYENRVLFDKYNLTIEDGEFVVLKGVSGCGKTTLLHMIGGLEKPDSGEIIYNGHNINNRRYLQKYLQSEVGFLFQNFALIENKTVLENLNIVKKQVRTQYTPEQVLDYVGLPDSINKKVYKLSGGEQQRVALARLMLKKCSFILADEPTGSLDSENAQRVIDILMDFNKQGKTIIMVTHSDILENKRKQIRIESIQN